MENNQKNYTKEDIQEITDLLGCIPNEEIPVEFTINLKKSLHIEVLKRRKHKLRMLSSLAAVFVVGIISYMAYDTIHILPDINQINTPMYTADKQAEASVPEETPVVVEEKQPVAQAPKIAKIEVDTSKTIVAPKNTIREKTTGDAIPERATGPRAMMSAPEKEENALTSDGGIENMAGMPANLTAEEREAANLYLDLIYKEFQGQNFTVKGYEMKNNGQWDFNIFLFSENNGTIEEEEILVIGQDGAIKRWEKEL